jgi:hypothetical protein
MSLGKIAELVNHWRCQRDTVSLVCEFHVALEIMHLPGCWGECRVVFGS